MMSMIEFLAAQRGQDELRHAAERWRVEHAAGSPRRRWRRALGEALIRAGQRLSPPEPPRHRPAPRLTRTAS
jgi:hypothetical protein